MSDERERNAGSQIEIGLEGSDRRRRWECAREKWCAEQYSQAEAELGKIRAEYFETMDRFIGSVEGLFREIFGLGIRVQRDNERLLGMGEHCVIAEHAQRLVGLRHALVGAGEHEHHLLVELGKACSPLTEESKAGVPDDIIPF